MTNEEIIKRLEAIASAELVVDGLKVGAITKETFEAIQETARLAISALKDLEVCRNELCLRCGQYKQRHLGACDGCRWYEAPDDYNQSQIQCHGC
jgi:hypothetical protein